VVDREHEPAEDGPDRETEFTALLLSAKSGDEDSLAELLQTACPYLLAIVNRDFDRDLQAKLGSSDVVQESLLRAHAAIDQFDGATREEFLAWLRGLLKNDMRNSRRHYKGIQKRSIDREQYQTDRSDVVAPEAQATERTPSTRAVAEEEARILMQAMEQLSDEYRQVIQYRNWDQLSFDQIGQKMERSSEAVRKLWGRAIKQLQSILER
jgi:RNA polymerase sigma-70 factor (ECF subfamily)